MMGLKRKRDLPGQTEPTAPIITRPKAGTKAFASGKAVKDALDTASPQAFVSFRQQIVTPNSSLPLAINNPTVVILQHYLDVSPTCDEIFRAWQIGDQTKTEVQAQAAVELLSEIINILTPIPFFRSSVVGLVNKLVSPSELYNEYLNRLCQSGRRDDVYHGYLLTAAAIAVDPPSSTSLGSSSSGRLGLKVWSVLVEGGSVRGLGKQMGMRRRNKEGMVGYGENDPLDKPDIRHLILRAILPLLSTSAFQAHARSILPPLYSGLASDPPITVYRVLTALWNAISGPSPGLNRKTSLVLFHEKSLEHLWQLLARQDLEATTNKTISDIVKAFLEGITTVPGQGICFTDEGWYPRRVVDESSGAGQEEENQAANGGVGDDRNDNWRKGLHNRILGNVVRKVGHKAVDDDGVVGDWMAKVFEACPELISGYWAHSALAVDPRLNARWVATMAYIGRIISLSPPSISTFRQPVPAGADSSSAPYRSRPPAITVVIESILPSPLTKSHIMKGLQHTDGLVQHVTAITLARGLQKLSVVQELFLKIEKEVDDEPSTSRENPWIKARRELEMEARRRIPELSVIIAFAQKAATMAPAEPETEAEIALTSKSAMLTEIALRIFGLCNKTMPSIAAEMKFDAGRLLVSASSASAERRARREAREGSVISDSGSVASVGTMGTAGMGGGFGQARGDVEGFEALSQLHVLQLLGEVRDWNWMNKAAGSQYTYLYHILLLNLSTRQAVTRAKTVSLLEHLLIPTLLFEHDPSELSIWLEALPRASDNVSGPMLLAQQIHLLSFLDDCFRRTSKTPYRYIEDSFALVPEFFDYSRPAEMITPVMMTILEQLNAKIMGQLISTEAAGVVLVYMRRILLGLVGKQKDLKFLLAITNKFDEMLTKAKEAGQARTGLQDVVQGMKDDLNLVQGGNVTRKTKDIDPEAHRLREEADWSARSFEQTCLTTTAEQWAESDTPVQLNTTFIAHAYDATIIRRANFILQLLPSKKGILSAVQSKSGALKLLDSCLTGLKQDQYRSQLKLAIFENDYVKKLFLSDKGNKFRNELHDLSSRLRESVPVDAVLGEAYVSDLVEALKADKKGDKIEHNLLLINPWNRFLQPEPASKALKTIIKRSDIISTIINDTISDTISAIVVATKDPAYAMSHLKDLIKLQSTSAVLLSAQTAAVDRERKTSLTGISIKKGTVRELLVVRSDAAYELIALLSTSSKEAAKSVLSVLSKDTAELDDHRIIPTLEVLLDLPADMDLDVTKLAVSVLLSPKSPTNQVESAISIIQKLFSQGEEKILAAINNLKLVDYNHSFARLTIKLAEQGIEAHQSAVNHLLDLGLQYAVRICSKIGDLTQDEEATLVHLRYAIDTTEDVKLNAQLSEPVIMAIIQDRLAVEESVRLAYTLARRVEMKASFIRQQLQALLASSAYNRCVDSACPASVRLNYIRLLHALFSASTYVSCQPNFIEPLVLLYRGTLSESDRLILNMFQLFENYRKLSVSSILKYWSSNGIVGSGNRSFDALTSLDSQKVFATCQAYPLRRTSKGSGKADQQPEVGESSYDPVFVMSLLTYTMSEGTITGLDWVEILRSNVLGLTICSLSSRDRDVRAVAGYALAKVYSLVLKKPFYERNQLLYTLRLLRHTIETPTTRLPVLTTLFFAHALRSLANPSHFLYPLTSRFLLQRPVFDPADTPMLYGMLYASGDGWKRERGWMIRFLKEGVRSEADWRVIRRRKVWSLLATLFSSSLDPMFRRTVLQSMESMISLPTAARSLVLRDSLILWLSNQWVDITRRQKNANQKLGSGNKPQTWEKEETLMILYLIEKICMNMIPNEIERIKIEDKQIGNWLAHLDIFFQRVLEDDMDVEKLEYLLRILYRISFIPKNQIVNKFLSPLTEQSHSSRLTKLLDHDSNNNLKERIISYLFHTGLNLPNTISIPYINLATNLKESIDEIRWKVEIGEAGTELSEWVKKQQRPIDWEQ